MNDDHSDELPGEQLLLPTDTRITCPSCRHEFSLAQGFAKKALEQLTQASADHLATLERSARDDEERRFTQRFASKERALLGQIADLTKAITERDSSLEKALSDARTQERNSAAAELDALKATLKERDGQLDTLRSKSREIDERETALAAREKDLNARVEGAAKEKAAQLVSQERQMFESELKEKADQISVYQARELELRREKNKLEEAKRAMELEVQTKLDEGRKAIEESARAAEATKFKLREAELQKTVEDMNAKLQEAQRKAAQGSQQLQGEVLEVLLEEELRAAFPLDAVAEVKKGARGGDIIHRVMTRGGHQAGVILWEAKRAASWSRDWTTKLKEDLRAASAEVGVIVSTVFPKEFSDGQSFGLYEDVWVAGPSAAVPLAGVLRAGLHEVHKQRVINTNKGEKMEALYDYLTSAQFGQKMKAVYTAFKKMREELDSEKSATQQRWARREKQIQLATQEIVAIAGDIQGLAHQDLPQLEMEPPGPAMPGAADMVQVDIGESR